MSKDSDTYVFITVLGQGVPWCERDLETTFDEFMRHTFGSTRTHGRPLEGQDMEFSCAHPTSSGSNSLLKPASASDIKEAVQTSRIILALRGFILPEDAGEILSSLQEDPRPTSKFWLVVKVKKAYRILPELANDRSSPYRRRPDEIAAFFDEDDLETIKAAILQVANKATPKTLRKQKRQKCEVVENLRCLTKLVNQLGVPEKIPEEKRSTEWRPQGLVSVLAPSDIIRFNCTCARRVHYSMHMSKDCRGLGTSNVAQKTRFGSEAEVSAAICHAMKCTSLTLAPIESVSKEDVLRLKVYPENLGYATLVCRMETYMDSSKSAGNVHNDAFATDKHRMMWLIHTHELSHLTGDHHASSASSRDVHLPHSEGPLNVQEVAYQKGTLHVIKAAPKRDYSTRITLEPPLELAGEYLGVVLGWVGNRVYQHTAIVLSAGAENTLGLGILRPVFHIWQAWKGKAIDTCNVLHGRVDPSSHVIKSILQKRKITLSHDQETCMRTVNTSMNAHLKIQAFAGTGKTMVLAILVEAALTKPHPSKDAVVIVTPSRNLRDSILQGSDFNGHVFNSKDLGPRVLWLGRPSNSKSPASLGSWEEHMATLVNARLQKELSHLRNLEDGVLKVTYKELKKHDLEQVHMQPGQCKVLPEVLDRELCFFRSNSIMYMEALFELKQRRQQEMEKMLDEPRHGYLIVSTMDAWVKWRAGEIKGPINRVMQKLDIKLFCMEEFESFDLPQVVAALSNLSVNTLLMVGDVYQRVESCRHRGKRVNLSGEGTFSALQIARDGIEDDQERYDWQTASVDHSGRGSGKRQVSVPEARPWYEWTNNADRGVLHLCKRCGSSVTEYIRKCFDFAREFASDDRIAFPTSLAHVFFDGELWKSNPMHRAGWEVGWHGLLFQSLCHIILSDLTHYQQHYSGGQDLPHPTVLVIMPLSRSAIPLTVLIENFLLQERIPRGVVEISLPLSARGESVPIVHCVRHRRFLQHADQYAGTQQNLQQEYINLTRGMMKTCMWVEEQPFGLPGSAGPNRPSDEPCAKYATIRNEYIYENLRWRHLKRVWNFPWSFYTCFGKWLPDEKVKQVETLAEDVWKKLNRKQIHDLPQLGQGFSDFNSLDEVLTEATGKCTDVSCFAFETTKALHEIGHGRTAENFNVSRTFNVMSDKVDPLAWEAAIKISHLLLPCATAEISSQEDKGVSRLCLPFIHIGNDPPLEDAITSLCSLTWTLAFCLDQNLVRPARLKRISHKMHIREEDGDLWFNKACKSGRMATAIAEKDKMRNNFVYMYIGGGGVDYEQSYLLGGLVVNCKSWTWAALVYAAARMVGRARSNPLGPLNSDLQVAMEGEEKEALDAIRSKFNEHCESVWTRIRECTTPRLHDLETTEIEKSERPAQCEHIACVLHNLKSKYEGPVRAFLTESG